MKLLLTRPAEDSAALALRLRQEGHEVLISPLFEPRFSATPPSFEDVAAVMATSRNGVRALLAHPCAKLLSLPFFAVGEETALEAEKAGFAQILTASPDAAALAALIARKHQGGPILYLAGKTRKPQLEQALSEKGFSVITWEGYDMRPAPALSREAVAALQDETLGAALFFSQNAAQHFLRLCESLNPGQLNRVCYLCFSADVALPFAEKGLSVRCCKAPHREEMLALVAQLAS